MSDYTLDDLRTAIRHLSLAEVILRKAPSGINEIEDAADQLMDLQTTLIRIIPPWCRQP